MDHKLPPLPYAVSALEPYIDSRTMALHHGIHHASYVAALNRALRSAPALQNKTTDWLLLNLSRVPEKIRTDVRNNAGGHANHSLLWRSMSPVSNGDGVGTPTGILANAINNTFGSFDNFKTSFVEAGEKLFGSGWVWLVATKHGDEDLQLLTTYDHDNPIAQGYVPILVNDVWEHAYYLKHENRRVDYLRGWWCVVNWAEAAARYEYMRSDIELSSKNAGNYFN